MTEPETLPRHPAGRTPSRRLAAGVTLIAGLLLSGCTGDGVGTDGDAGALTGAAGVRLVSFDSCEQAETSLRAAALEHLAQWSLPGTGDVPPNVLSAAEDGGNPEAAGRSATGGQPADAAAAPGAAPAPPGAAPAAPPLPGAAATRHSGTNVHEQGVDEPDLVKTDGRRIVTVTDGVLRVVDVGRRIETGTLPLWDRAGDGYLWRPADLLLHGDVALVLAAQAADPISLPVPLPGPQTRAAPGGLVPPPAGDPRPVDAPEPAIAGPKLLLVDLAGQPVVRAEYEVDGHLVDARATGGMVRVVVRSGPRLAYPMIDPAADEQARRRAYLETVGSARLDDWLPRYRLAAGGTATTGQVDCTAVSHPPVYSGASMLTVLTFDLSTGTLGEGDPVSVVADGDTVYSNGTRLYVASDQRWRAAAAGGPGRAVEERTDIYTFDLSRPGPPRYVAAGAVPGWLVNQYAMSEWDGHLRVATTSTQAGSGGDPAPGTVSAVYVLAERDGALVQTGSVSGLGVGERIYSVRFTGPVGYVVTFRQTDPLYTLDLTDPTAPAVRGELKITGYSSYLHPVGAGRLLGVGQEADGDGVVQGTQVSLFDVSDLAVPAVLDRHLVRYGTSEAEADPHAFLWWEPAGVAVVPVSTPVDPATGRASGAGVLVLRLESDRLVEAGFITHPAGGMWPYGSPIRRSLVIGETLWTVSHHGLQANDLATLRTTGWIPFS